MLVEATKLGHYGNKRRREGEKFVLKSDKDFSKNWMKKVSGKAPPKEPEPVVDEAAPGSSDGEVI